MFWADKLVDEIQKKYKEKISKGEPLVIRDEKTASGRVLVSAVRGAVIHGIVSEILSQKNLNNKFLWEINDTDAFRSIPQNLDAKKYREYLGMPLYKLPSPQSNEAENYPEYFAKEFTEVITYLGFTPTYYRGSVAYKEGKFNDAIKTALEKAELIRDIYKKISGSEKPNDWMPLMVVCEQCGKIGTTKTISFDGEKVEYICDKNVVEWAEGCNHEGKVSPFNGNATLPWKVEWAAKFKVFGVDVEGGGKDLSTRGGARDVANHIAREVFEYEPPYNIPYEFFLVGGKKMSTSKGNAPAAREIMNLLPSHIYRLVYLGKNYKHQIEFNIKGDTVPTLFDTYDRLAEKYFGGVEDDDTRLFKSIHSPGTEIKNRYLPRFSQVAFLVQMPHIDTQEEVVKIKGSALTADDKKELEERAHYAKQWLKEYAPEEFKYQLQESLPEEAKKLSTEVKALLKQVLKYIEAHKKLDGAELHHELHAIRKASSVEPAEFFSALYLIFLGKESGPKAGWFLSVLDREFLIKRLKEVAE